MNHKVDYGELDSLTSAFFTSLSEMSERLQTANGLTEHLKTTKSMSGNTADNMRSYFEYAYGSIIGGLGELINAFANNWKKYTADYYNSVDSNHHAVIFTDELEELKTKLESLVTPKGYVDQDVQSAANSISDIATGSYSGITYVAGIHERAAEILDKTLNAVNDLENGHSSGDFDEIDGLVKSMTALMQSLMGQKSIYKQEFDLANFAGSKEFGAFYDAYETLSADLQSKSAEFEQANKTMQRHGEVLQAEYEERKRQAENFKKGVLVLTIVASAVVTVATAGAASPILVGAVSGAVTGAVVAGANTAADMYAAGGWGNINFGEVGKAALIGGIKGAVTGAVSGALSMGADKLGACLRGPIDKISSPILQKSAEIGSKVFIGGTEKALEGITDRTVDAVFTGKWDDVLDGKSIANDFIKGGVSSGVKEVIPDIEIAEGAGKADAVIEKALWGGLESWAGGASGRFVSTFITEDGDFGHRFQEAVNKANDETAVLADITAGATAAGTKEYIEQTKLEDISEFGKQRKNEIKQESADEANKEIQEKTKSKNESGERAKTTEKMKDDDPDLANIQRNGSNSNLDYSETDVIYERDGVKADFEIEYGKDRQSQDGDPGTFKRANDKYREMINDPTWKQPKNDPRTPENEGYTWHEVDARIDADGTVKGRVQLVPTDKHEGYSHVGGCSEAKELRETYDTKLTDKDQQAKEGITDQTEAAIDAAKNTKDYGKKEQQTDYKMWEDSFENRYGIPVSPDGTPIKSTNINPEDPVVVSEIDPASPAGDEEVTGV